MEKRPLLKSGQFWLMLFLVLSVFTFFLKSRGPHDISSISLSESAYRALQLKYERQGEEFIVCAYGYIHGDTAYINAIYEPKTFTATHTEASFKECSIAGVLGTIHKHPVGACSFSAQDMVTFGKLGHDFMGVMCRPDKIIGVSQFDLRPVSVEVR